MKHRVIIVMGCFLALTILAACDSANSQSPTLPQASATTSLQLLPCVTATPATSGAILSITGSIGSAQRTTPGTVQQPPSPAELATREAQLENQNRPVTLPVGAVITPSLPVCPTTTPIK